jgi:hypothetical protein
MTKGDAIITDEAPFVQHKRRFKYLKRWRELAISVRPFEYECLPQDFDLLQHKGQDDCDVLMIRCLEARADMNNHLPPHEHVMDEDLVPAESYVENAGHGLFFRPSLSGPRVILACQVISYYCGHIHDFHSSNRLKDKSYLMMVANDVLVDPGPLPNIKARYINDLLNELYINTKFVPEPACDRCAVVATRNIKPGEGLFVSYGEAYWANQGYEGTVYSGKGIK